MDNTAIEGVTIATLHIHNTEACVTGTESVLVAVAMAGDQQI
jgi:hypothetical protein